MVTEGRRKDDNAIIARSGECTLVWKRRCMMAETFTDGRFRSGEVNFGTITVRYGTLRYGAVVQ